MPYPPEQIQEWTRMRQSGMTIEQVALEVGVPHATIQRYTPKGIQGRNLTREHHRVNRSSKRTSYLDPTARIANDGYIRRNYR